MTTISQLHAAMQRTLRALIRAETQAAIFRSKLGKQAQEFMDRGGQTIDFGKTKPKKGGR